MVQYIPSSLQQQALMLMQAMLGVISPNFRMVSISLIDQKIEVTVVLEHESDEDREELEDCESEFEALQSVQIDYEFKVVVSEDNIEWPGDTAIVIYRRKEN